MQVLHVTYLSDVSAELNGFGSEKLYAQRVFCHMHKLIPKGESTKKNVFVIL